MATSDFNISVRDDKKTKIQHLTFEGDLGVKNIAKVKARLESFDLKRTDIFIHLKAIDSFDLSTVQLIYSLMKSFKQLGKRIKLYSDLPDISRQTLRNNGFDDLLNLEIS